VPDPVDARLLALVAEVGRVAVHDLAARAGLDVREVAARLAALAATGLPLVVGVECDPAALRYALASPGWAGPAAAPGTVSGAYPVGTPSGAYPPPGQQFPQGPPSGPHPVPGYPQTGPNPSQTGPSGPVRVPAGPSAGPGGPSGPVGPGGQVGPSGQIGPAGQIGPGGQIGPSGQIAPTGQIAPSGPVAPSRPGHHGQPSQPTSQPFPAQRPPDPIGTWGPPQTAAWARGDQEPLASTRTVRTVPSGRAGPDRRTGAVGDVLHTEGLEGERLAIQLIEVVDPADFLFTAAGYRLQPGERSVVVHTELTNRGTVPFSSLPDLYLVLVDTDGKTVSKAPVSLSSRPPHRIGVQPGETAGGHTVYVLPEGTELTAVRWSPRPDDESRALTWSLTEEQGR
jgi:hypothetical protein